MKITQFLSKKTDCNENKYFWLKRLDFIKVVYIAPNLNFRFWPGFFRKGSQLKKTKRKAKSQVTIIKNNNLNNNYVLI